MDSEWIHRAVGDAESNRACEAPRPQGGASRARSGEQDASKGSFVHIVPLPACR